MNPIAATLHVLTPHYKPNGGVVKLMDYATHALSGGFRVSVWSREEPSPALPLFGHDRYRRLLDDPRVNFHSERRLTIRARDLALVSLPRDFDVAQRSLADGMSPERIIHIIQNVRHANPFWNDGYALRLLTRPVARISTNFVIFEAIRQWLDDRAYHEVINLGHDLDFFHTPRPEWALSTPIRVAHTTWKSAIGDQVEAAVADERFVFESIRDHVGWAELRRLYHWADVFLCAPDPEEGVYMPAIEAMAAGCIVVGPDVGGNRSYWRPGENGVQVEYESVDSYAAALREIRGWDSVKVADVRRSARQVMTQFDLGVERRAFLAYLRQLWDRIDAYERAPAAPAAAMGSAS
jgi:hypothetical protein